MSAGRSTSEDPVAMACNLRAAVQQALAVELVAPFLLQPGRPWELVDTVLGVSKPFVYRLYGRLRDRLESSGLRDDPDVVALTLVALLATTENQRIINLRKNLLENNKLGAGEELHTLDVLLASPMARHNKSPMLWAQRQWLQQAGYHTPNYTREMDVIGAGATNHPCNYYAWAYARWLFGQASQHDVNSQAALGSWAWQLCSRNLSDISMWSFLQLTGESYYEQAQALYDRYPHEAIAKYLQYVEHKRQLIET